MPRSDAALCFRHLHTAPLRPTSGRSDPARQAIRSPTTADICHQFVELIVPVRRRIAGARGKRRAIERTVTNKAIVRHHLEAALRQTLRQTRQQLILAERRPGHMPGAVQRISRLYQLPRKPTHRVCGQA